MIRELSKQAQHFDATPKKPPTTSQDLTSEGQSNHLEESVLKTNPESILTEVVANPELGKQIMVSARGREINHGEIRLKIFRLSFPNLETAIEGRTLTQNEIFLCLEFMIGIRCKISQDDLDGFTTLKEYFIEMARDIYHKKRSEYPIYLRYAEGMQIVLGKLLFQASFKDTETYFSEDIHNFAFHRIHAIKLQCRTEKVPTESALYYQILYLSLIPTSDAFYRDAQLKLSEIWRDELNNVSIAGECLLAGMDHETEKNLELAASYLLARHVEGSKQVYILREDLEEYTRTGNEVVLLDESECRRFNLEDLSKTFYELKRKKSFTTIEALLTTGRDQSIDEAWLIYREIAYIPALDRSILSNKIYADRVFSYHYAVVPSESLLRGLMKFWDIKKVFSKELLKDCAQAYPSLFAG